jgi:glycosyltransferase involved in cell wall biosynthesis
MVSITQGLKDDLVNDYGLAADHIHVLPDGVDVRLFKDDYDTTDLEQALPVRPGAKRVLYIGHLYGWKGVDVLAGAAKHLPEHDFLFVGGYEDNVAAFREKYRDVPNIILTGHVPQEETARYMKLADVLVLPNSGAVAISSKHTSPLKLFAYMACNCAPIVASDLPSIREILTDGKNAFLVEPDNVEALTNGITRALTAPEADSIVATAAREVEQYDWKRRTEALLATVHHD